MFDRRTILGGLACISFAPRAWAQTNNLDALIDAIEGGTQSYPGASGQIEAKELIRSTFAAAQPQQGKSKRAMSSRTIRIIAAFEVSNKKRYENLYRRPLWPGKDSGVTIGIGYDLGYASETAFEADWHDYMKPEARALLKPTLGRKRTAAQAALPAVQTVEVPYDDAHRQFVDQTLPKYVAQTEFALENTAALPDDSMGALVSLTFNRGPSYLFQPEKDKKGRFREMREIRALMRREDFAAIPAQIRSMKRLWKANSDVGGLIGRREVEAQLFEAGLKG
jgi:GH24 family phage-related lysozyme (muramidase)